MNSKALTRMLSISPPKANQKHAIVVALKRKLNANKTQYFYSIKKLISKKHFSFKFHLSRVLDAEFVNQN